MNIMKKCKNLKKNQKSKIKNHAQFIDLLQNQS